MTVWCSWLGCRVFQHFTAQGPADPSGCSKTSQGHVAVVNLVAAGFTPWQVHPHIESTSDQMFKIYLSFTEKNDNLLFMMKQNHSKLVYFLFFNPLKVTGKHERESLK